jgi:uncharacterized protein YebE (UPF0316 family)
MPILHAVRRLECMDIGFDLQTLLTGVMIFGARVGDVTLGTVRTISIVQGRTKTAFCLGFIEVSIWLVVISTVVGKVMTQPVLGVFYALGFSTGNVVGILLERRIAFGHTILRIISHRNAREIVEAVRCSGHPVTTFEGEGRSGPVTELCIVCRRKDLRQILPIVRKIEPEVFYLTEHPDRVSKLYCPSGSNPTGWRAILKKK